MSAQSKTSMTSTFILLFLGTVALCTGTRWLAILVPLAIILWFATCPRLRTGRN
jgi:hypothetical protein